MASAVKLTASPTSASHSSKPKSETHGALVWNVALTGGGASETTGTVRWLESKQVPETHPGPEPGRLTVSRTV